MILYRVVARQGKMGKGTKYSMLLDLIDEELTLSIDQKYYYTTIHSQSHYQTIRSYD